MSTKQLYNLRYFQGSKKFQKDKKRLSDMSDFVMSYNPRNVLDVGCGIGCFVRFLRNKGVDAVGIDFSDHLPKNFWKEDENYLVLGDAKSLPFTDKSFDIVFSSDFFEHLPEEEIDRVSLEMRRVGKIVLARVAYEDKLTKKQALYHMTNKPELWWRNKLKGILLI